MASASERKKRSDTRFTRRTATAPERRFEHFVLSYQSSGMRGCRARRCFGSAGLDGDDRLAERDLPRGREKRTGVPDGLHVDEDALRMGIVAEALDQVAPADVNHGAHRNEGAESHQLAPAPIEYGCS